MGPMQKSWLAEKQSAVLYEALAEKEANSDYGELFRKLGKAALEQAAIWEKQMAGAGQPVPAHVAIGIRLNLILLMIRVVGVKPLRTILAAAKIRGLSVYSHALPSHPLPVNIADVGRRHTSSAFGGNLRASVFGMNDGMVSNGIQWARGSMPV